ncbi:alpha/beta fold hydrolase [Nocardia sp. CDC160]|uniref:alpha/beta fold hydrolase n=1 Tax=Nocardia sp. CDC160 TaxID=3112166 RepID=UPI002DBC8FE5|nr:alpha/beta fold hydrolase [Nocardia sp. CDC160]MEC3916973.1 alpha/beta fold hydrolase [Nocardia sp. CDC160]
MAAQRIRRLVLGATLLTAAAVALPAGPTSADPAPELDRFYHQSLDWKPCDDATLDAAGAQCAGVLVPLDYDNPNGRTLTVAISRIAATDPSRRRGILLSNPGGPGGQGLRYTNAIAQMFTPDVRAQYDLIGMDPRGVGRSDAVNCTIPVPTMLFSAGFDIFGYARDTAVAAALATACVGTDPEKARHITTRNTARDMDVIRSVFGEAKLNYYGASYGTYLGSVYTQMFGDHADRVILDSPIDPDRYYVGLYQDMGPINEYALDDWAAWAARHDDEYHFGATAEQVRGFVEDLIRRSAGHEIYGSGYLVDEHTIPMMLLALLPNPQLNTNLADVVHMVDVGVSGGPIDMAALKAKIVAAVPLDAASMAAIMCGDKAAPRDPAWYYANVDAARKTQPVFGAFANNITACAFWPDPVEPPAEIHNATPVLMLANVHDTRTAYQEGLALHRDLTDSRLVTLADTRVHGAFRPGLSPCLIGIVNTYLDTGARPTQDVTCEPDFSWFPQ